MAKGSLGRRPQTPAVSWSTTRSRHCAARDVGDAHRARPELAARPREAPQWENPDCEVSTRSDIEPTEPGTAQNPPHRRPLLIGDAVGSVLRVAAGADQPRPEIQSPPTAWREQPGVAPRGPDTVARKMASSARRPQHHPNSGFDAPLACAVRTVGCAIGLNWVRSSNRGGQPATRQKDRPQRHRQCSRTEAPSVTAGETWRDVDREWLLESRRHCGERRAVVAIEGRQAPFWFRRNGRLRRILAATSCPIVVVVLNPVGPSTGANGRCQLRSPRTRPEPP